MPMNPKARKQQRIDDGSDPIGARLQNVMGMGTTSDSNIAKIMKSLEGSAPSKKHLTQVRHAKFESLKHVIRVPLLDGSFFDWHLCHPGLLLTRIVSESVALQCTFKEALHRHPCSPDRPWRLMVGFDEHIPGNKLNLQPARKSMNLSFSFEELGGSCMCERF